jgi:hypothetical protein
MLKAWYSRGVQLGDDKTFRRGGLVGGSYVIGDMPSKEIVGPHSIFVS